MQDEMVVVRNFRYDDIDRIADIVSSSLGEYYPTSLYLEKSRDWEDGFIVGVENGRVVAMLLGIVQGRFETRILMFAVDRQFRRRGIGHELMNRFIGLSVAKGAKRISLEVRRSNLEAIRFYEKYGFQHTGVLLMYYSDMEDGLKMAKNV